MNAPAAVPTFRSGFVSIVGRPNVGKSTLCNRLVGTKVAITSSKPQTTRHRILGVRTTDTSQLVLVDTPGLHRPRTLLGERCNRQSLAALAEVDAACLVVEADARVGPGDRFVASAIAEAGSPVVVVVNKTDRAGAEQIAEQLATVAGLVPDAAAFVPASARTGDGVSTLARELERLLPEGPHYFPEGTVTDQPEAVLLAELLREQLLVGTRDELPHSITVVVDEIDERGDLLVVRAIVYVERPSQRGIVIGRGGEGLRRAGSAARRQMEALLGMQVHLETVVRVEPDWQRRAHALDRLGFTH